LSGVALRFMERLTRNPARRHRISTSSQDVVERAEAYVRAHIDDPVPVSELCQLMGLSERGLRDAFYRVRGIGPKRWIVAERLQAVRDTLSDQAGGPITVTDAAADYGFYELGRFAAIYRAAFGEAPSDTLRSTSRNARGTNSTDLKTRIRRCLPQHVR
jgi:AraC-like DNA-binding protein